MSISQLADQLTGSVLVVGGGIAGIQASLDLADQGYRIYLVERKSAIGGHMAQLDKTFPTNDCAMCTISPKLVEVGRHLNIELMVDTEVVSIEGDPGSLSVTLRRKPRYVDVEKCVGCGECVAVCPVHIPDPYNEGLSDRRAIYKLYPQAVPNAYAIDKLGMAPCRGACPAGQRAQGYIALIAEGRYREALRVIKEDNPFPSVCGRTCHHPCESHCTRGLVDDPVAIMSLKRFVVDYALAYGREKVEPAPRTRPEWVAVVGAGPAGLTAAHDLVKMGYGVTVYEALPVAGGMMRAGIPAHRLPKGVLQQDIDDILALGVNLKTNSPIQNPMDLLQEGYNAVCVATGISSHEHTLGIPGEDSLGVISAATFLRKINLGEGVQIGDRVAVVGGGITALDAAAVARRLGAQEVTLALDRPRGELPAYHWEVASIEAEGIHLLEHATATRILSENGRATQIELALTDKGMWVDEQGRRQPKIQPGSEFTLDIDTVIITVGQHSDLCFLDPEYEELESDPDTLAGDYPGLFVVGGRKTGASYIVEAIALGHRVARSIEHFLQGKDLKSLVDHGPPVVKFSREEIAEQVESGMVDPQPRQEPALIPMQERVTSFREVVLGLTEHQARAEAQRCLQCGICSECLACEYVCGMDAIDHEMEEETFELQVGAVILAPGFQTYQAESAQEFGLGRYPDVITALQMERMLNASGPSSGKIYRPSNRQTPQKVAFLQCIGSRDLQHDYCSAVCCMYATKEAMLLREHHPNTEAHIFLMDARAFSKGYEAYYQRAREQGVRYTRCRISSLHEDPETRQLILRYMNQTNPSRPEIALDLDSVEWTNPEIMEERFDLVVLSVGMEIPAHVRSLGETLGIELDSYGFCRSTALQPIQTSRPGVFAVGPFVEPKDIPESVIDASGAAGLASSILAPVRGELARKPQYPSEKDISDLEPRVGVFVCHCGSNIAGYVDVEAVTGYSATIPSVVHAEHLLYACSQDSTSLIQQRIEEHQLNRIVVASCTPLTHGPLFQDVIRQAGLNEHLFAMANIRNQCSWVHSEEPEAATLKASDLIRMAVARVVSLQPLERPSIPLQHTALVIGAGPAGMNTALALARQDFPVHLVERQDVLGGRLRETYSNLPMEGYDDHINPMEYLAELTEQIENHPLIHIHLNTTVEDTSGFVGNFQSVLLEGNGDRIEIQHGVTIVATGGEEYRGPEYGYGQNPRILTQGEFGKLLEGPTNGDQQDIEGLPDPETLKHVVMIQCIGPAEKYCARTCCTIALKNAIHLKTQNPMAQVTILHRDIRTYGFKERLYRKARELGVGFIRYDPDEKPDVHWMNNDAVNVEVWDPTLKMPLQLNADLLVLSMPVVPASGSHELASRLKVPVDMDGWFLEAHIKLRPVEFASDGIFLAGTAHYPKLLNEAIVQALAAASRAAVVLSKETLTAGGAVAHVDPNACTGCLTCVRICPFGIPVISSEELGVGGVNGAAYIEPTVCQGCGTCVGECPANAIELMHYTHLQVEGQVLSLFKFDFLDKSV